MQHNVRRKRIDRVLVRARRLRTLGRFGRDGLRIARTALGPAALFAAAVTGVLPSHLVLLRRAFHLACVRKPSRRAATMDIALLDQRADPSFQALVAPIGWLCKELSCRTSPRFMVQQCITKASEVQGRELEKKPGSSCMKVATGPVSTAVAAARTIGWKHLGEFRWETAVGSEVNLATAAPESIRRLAERDVLQHVWRQAAARHRHLAHLDGAPYLDAARELLAEGSGLSCKQKGLLRAFLAGAFFKSTTCTCGEHFDDPLHWWSHFAWECPNTQPARDYMQIPQHIGKKSIEGLDEQFMQKVRRYLHLPWIQTAVLPDPRDHFPGPAAPEIIEWRVPEGGMAALSSNCFGDGSCSRRGPEDAQRAGWSLGEAYLHDGRAGAFRIGRNVAGTLPGHIQTAEGAESYVLVMWLRHLDPCSRIVPRLFLDCERVVDGWHRCWNTLAPWVPHRDLWQEVERLRCDTMHDVKVIWLPSHRPLGAGGGEAALRVFGNTWADKRAKEAATWHPRAAECDASLARTHAMSRQLCVAYSKLLEWAVAVPGRLPPVTPLEVLFKTPRPPKIPEHSFAEDPAGVERCVRCMLPSSLTSGRPCRPHGTLGHSLMSLGTGIFLQSVRSE